MSAETRHGGGTKATKATKITKTKLVFFVVFVSFVIVAPPWRVAVSSQAQQSEQRPPVFRAGAHYVRVDAYPTKSGKIIEGLTRDDFEVFEDGKPQSIENAEFVTPAADRFSGAHARAEGSVRTASHQERVARSGARPEDYTTNTTWDGGLRSINVRLRPKRPSARPGTGETIRARRQYRAPTREEIAAISASVSPARSAAPAAASQPPPMVRKPVAYLVHPRAAAQPADVTHLTRTNRIRVEWEAIGALEQRTARILDRIGKPLAIEVPISEQDGRVVVELPLAAFARGEYALELTVRSGSIVERSPLAFRVQ